MSCILASISSSNSSTCSKSFSVCCFISSLFTFGEISPLGKIASGFFSFLKRLLASLITVATVSISSAVSSSSSSISSCSVISLIMQPNTLLSALSISFLRFCKSRNLVSPIFTIRITVSISGVNTTQSLTCSSSSIKAGKSMITAS